MMVIEKVVPLDEGEEYLAHLEVDDSSAEESSTAQRRADADMALIRAGRASLDKPGHVDRFTLHVVADLDRAARRVGRARLIDGTPIAIETLRRIACDCGIVRHLMKAAASRSTSAPARPFGRHAAAGHPGSGPRALPVAGLSSTDLRLPPRRPPRRRRGDGGVQRMSALPRHHTCTHEGGFGVSGEANGTLTFVRPDGTILGRTAA